MVDNSPSQNGPIRKTVAPRWKRVGKVLLALALGLVVTYCTLRALVGLPPVSGPYPVGQSTVVFTDQDHVDPWSDQPRELLVYAFYPAADKGSPVGYFPNLSVLSKNFEGVNSILVRLLPFFLTPSASENAQLIATPQRFPVVLFSPGAHAAVFQYRTILEDLASHGYLVLALEATHEGVGQVFPDNRVVDPVSNQEQSVGMSGAEVERFYRKRVDVRAADLSFVARQLNDDDLVKVCPAWVGRIDAQRIASLGHSLGGVAAVEAARREPRLVAATNLDGHFNGLPCLPEAEPLARHAALLVIEDEPPQERAAASRPQDQAASEALARWQARQPEIEAHLSSVFRHREKLLLQDTQHSDFSDEPFFYPHWTSSSWNVDIQRLKAIRDKLRDFLDHECARDSTGRSAERPD